MVRHDHSGVKREEYREIKPYWTKRLDDCMKRYDKILFRNGYNKSSPRVLVELVGCKIGRDGNTEWGSPVEGQVFILSLGKIIYAY